ncbi:MAG: T9SS type A sorting domain-containing protein [Bacteroidota bacterium]|nr:T9SS type A sorting domain-containing protein [Bacteroidota bacterium]
MKKFLLLFFALFIFSFMMAQDCSDLFFSEYVEGSHNNKALEVYNPTGSTIDLSDYQMSRYSNGGTSPNYVGLAPGGVLNAHSVIVIVLDKQDPTGTGMDTIVFDELRALADIFLCPVYEQNKMMYFNGNDAVTLEKISDGTILDIIGKVGEDPGYGWTDDPSSGYTDIGEWWRLWTKDQTLIRKPTIKEGVHLNPNEFNATTEWDSLPRNTFDSLGSHTCDCGNTVSINENFTHTPRIVFFPNPSTDGKFMVQASNVFESVVVYNSLGQVVFKREQDVAFGKMEIDMDKPHAGLYFVKVNFSDKSTVTRKILIK